MNIKEVFRIIKFLRGHKSCIVINENLVIEQFGKEDEHMDHLGNRIMLIRLYEQAPGSGNIEEAAALRIHGRAMTAGKNYADEHGHSIVEEVAYGRGYKAGYMIGCREMYDKVTAWLKKNLTFTHPRKETEECPINFGVLNDAMCKDEG